MLWCKSSRPILVTARVCVCLNPRTKCFLSPPNFVRALLLYLRQNPRETFVWGKGRVVYVAFITSSRGPKSNDTRARRRKAAVFVSVLSTRGGKGPSSSDDAGQEGGSSKRRRSQFLWGKTSPFFWGRNYWTEIFWTKKSRTQKKTFHCEKWRKDDDGF